MGPFKSTIYANNQNVQLGSRYADYAAFVHPSSIWFVRGGSYNAGVDSDIFNFNFTHGSVYERSSFRIVLTPPN